MKREVLSQTFDEDGNEVGSTVVYRMDREEVLELAARDLTPVRLSPGQHETLRKAQAAALSDYVRRNPPKVRLTRGVKAGCLMLAGLCPTCGKRSR